MKVFSVYKGLDKSIYIMALTAFINCIGSFIGPFFSLYLIVRLQYDIILAGLMVSLLALVYIPGSLIGGKLCDHFGRKRIVVVSQTLMGLSFLCCGFLMNKSYAPVFIFIGNFFDGITDPARNALEVDVTTPDQRQSAFSLIYQGINMGMAIGPLLAGFLFYQHPNWLFWGNGIVELCTVVLVICFVKESKPTKEQIEESRRSNTNERAEDGSVMKALLKRPQLIWFSGAILLIAFAYKQITFTLPLQFVTLFGDSGAKFYGSVIALNALLVILLNPFILMLSKKRSEIKNVLLASLLYAISFVLFGFAKLTWQFYVLTIIFTIGEMLLNNNETAYRNNNTPINFRGRFNAILPLFKTTGRFLGPLLGGIILGVFSYQMLWVISGISVTISSLIFIYLLYKNSKKN